MARRIAFHKPLNADFHKYVLVQSFRYGGPCAWWGRQEPNLSYNIQAEHVTRMTKDLIIR